ncbi:MAG: tRNA (adenosine(37)-N6)-dimethylallyltransferase MiaA [Bacteroidales bacterium]|nr:MAG: tRNA (adenosine(37)-N6)-dimethylallyltransferase MiaA [Bacteroidales bacterium]
MPSNSKYLIVLLGPTGVGKTDLSIILSYQFNAPILSADSRQFYREMRIGTATPSEETLNAAPHHFIGNKSIAERYSCGMFELEALDRLEGIYKTHQSAMLVGGSGLYIDAVCNGIDDFPAPDIDLRKELYQQLSINGIDSLRKQLQTLDPDYYNQVDLKNTQRILKAVEVCLQTGRPFSSFRTQPNKPRSFIPIKIGLNRTRDELYQRINNRVDGMVADGLLAEVKGLYEFKHLNSLNTVGYKEIFDSLDGKITLEEAIELIKRNSRRYAKRQLTWWTRDKEIAWFNPEQANLIIEYTKNRIQNG